MFAEERQLLIAELVTEYGRVTVNDLATRFNVTPETVRRDLSTLEITRQLRRVHGGAVATDRQSLSEPSLELRQTQRLDEKSRIAAAALAMVPLGRTGSVVLDAGTTTERLADLLCSWQPAPGADPLLVITNAIPIAYKLSGTDAVQLHILGGRVRGLTRAIVGATTIEQLDALRPDIAFIGANGVHPDFGFSTPDSVEAAVKTAIVHSARRVVALADSTKLDEETLVRFATLGQIDTLITDAAPQPELAAALAAADVEVVIA
jgi:DeoR family fructose operon transcriptional repressor